ncbi:MAG: hypothetical protein HRT80_15295 [Henriciella sp.]|nr:hypothetical protein [Henriciella sp.]
MSKPPSANAAPLIEFDPNDFVHHLEGLELSDDQADELIRALAEIMLAFVDLGFGIAPSQKSCGQQDLAKRFLAGGISKMVHSSDEIGSVQRETEQEGV